MMRRVQGSGLEEGFRVQGSGFRVGNSRHCSVGESSPGATATEPRTLNPEPFSGFTLIEVLIVVVLMAILASVLVPAMGDSAPGRLRGAATILARDIQYVQAEAMNTGQTLQIQFPDDSQYQVVDPDGGAGGTALVMRHPQSDYPAHNGQFIVNFDDPGPLRGVTIQLAQFGGQPRLEFGKYGEPTAAGEIVLLDRGHQIRLSVSSITGMVSIGDLEVAP